VNSPSGRTTSRSSPQQDVTSLGGPAGGSTGLYAIGVITTITEDPTAAEFDCVANTAGASLSFVRITALAVASVSQIITS